VEMILAALYLRLQKDVAVFATNSVAAKHMLGVTLVAVHAGLKVVRVPQHQNLGCAQLFLAPPIAPPWLIM